MTTALFGRDVDLSSGRPKTTTPLQHPFSQRYQNVETYESQTVNSFPVEHSDKIGQQPLDLSKSSSPPRSHFFTISSLTDVTVSYRQRASSSSKEPPTPALPEVASPCRQRTSSSLNKPPSTDLLEKQPHVDATRRRSSSLDSPHQSKSEDYTNTRMRRHPSMTPMEVKDADYWEKRVKNNAAARRSRHSRRIKEVELTEYARQLEQKNVQLAEEVKRLRVEIAILKTSEKYHL